MGRLPVRPCCFFEIRKGIDWRRVYDIICVHEGLSRPSSTAVDIYRADGCVLV